MSWAPDYCTLAELKSYLKDDRTISDDELGYAITAASRAVDQATARQFGATDATEERTFPARYDRRDGVYVVETDDIATTSGLVVTVSGSALTASGYTLYPLNSVQKSRPFTYLTVATAPATVLVEATWGWSSVPTTIKQATLMQASRLAKRRESPFGVAGSPDLGSELRLLAKLDPDVEVVVGPYVRWWGARSG